jgi:hypothetical protein
MNCAAWDRGRLARSLLHFKLTKSGRDARGPRETVQ